MVPDKRLGHLLWVILAVLAVSFLGSGSWLAFGADHDEAPLQPDQLASPDKTGDLASSASTKKIPPLKSPNYLRTSGNKIVDSQGKEVRLTGVNWFGMETNTYTPHGLWARNWEGMLDQIVELGFNTIRLPFTNEMFEKDIKPSGINWDLNPDLKDLTPIEIMDKIIVGAGERGLKVILDRHRPSSDAQSDLWYTGRYSEDRWIQDWKMLAARYAGNDTVIGADLHNEPKGQATWGSGNTGTDWRMAAEKAGNAILDANPNLLIIVEGIDNYKGKWYWWGGNLMGAKESPVRLKSPGKLIYSAHDYGPGVYNQTWFLDKEFPTNLPKIWYDNWFYLAREGIAPILVGEFGGRSVGKDTEGIWQRTLARFLKENGISYTYWSLNPNSGDTGGILGDDWKNPVAEKLAVLAEYQFPLIKNGAPTRVNGKAQPTSTTAQAAAGSQSSSTPTTQQIAASSAGKLRVMYRSSKSDDKTNEIGIELRIENKGPTSIDLKDLELRYWLMAESLGGKRQVLTVDWASVDGGSIRSEFVPMPIARQSHFLRLTFGDGAGSLAGGGTMEIKARIHKDDWSEYNQSNDYSFKRSKESIEWDHITAYVKGTLAWGVEPCN